jgi:ketosteroid isomerase-like protein
VRPAGRDPDQPRDRDRAGRGAALGDLQQRLVLEELREDDHRAHVVAMVRRQWYWRARPGEVAHEEELTIVSTIRDGRIARWQPFEDRAEALRAAGLPGSV